MSGMKIFLVLLAHALFECRERLSFFGCNFLAFCGLDFVLAGTHFINPHQCLLVWVCWPLFGSSQSFGKDFPGSPMGRWLLIKTVVF